MAEPSQDKPRSPIKRLHTHVKTRAPEPVKVELTLHLPRWLVWSAAGVAAAALASYLLLDRPLRDITHTQPKVIERVAEWFTLLGDSLYYLIGGPIVIAVLWFMGRRSLAGRLGLVVTGLAVAGLAVNVLKVIFGRARPGAWWSEELWGFAPLSIGYDVNSFPSGHSAVAGAVAMGLALIWRRHWWVFLIYALVVGSTRVLLESHYLSDVIVGLYFGALSVIALKNFVWGPIGLWQEEPGRE